MFCWDKVLQSKNYTLSEFLKHKPKYIAYSDISDVYNFEGFEHLEKFMLDNYHPEKIICNYILYRVDKE